MADSSFDIVSKVDPQEVANALNQAHKEVEQRYDFKGVGASIEQSGDKILMKANSEERVKAILDVFQSKLVKRGVSLKSLEDGKPFPSGKEFRIEAIIKMALTRNKPKRFQRSSVRKVQRASRAKFKATSFEFQVNPEMISRIFKLC